MSTRCSICLNDDGDICRSSTCAINCSNRWHEECLNEYIKRQPNHLRCDTCNNKFSVEEKNVIRYSYGGNHRTEILAFVTIMSIMILLMYLITMIIVATRYNIPIVVSMIISNILIGLSLPYPVPFDVPFAMIHETRDSMFVLFGRSMTRIEYAEYITYMMINHMIFLLTSCILAFCKLYMYSVIIGGCGIISLAIQTIIQIQRKTDTVMVV